MITAECPNCEWTDSVSKDFLGQIAECPSCGSEFEVTELPTEEPSATPISAAERAKANMRAKKKAKATKSKKPLLSVKTVLTAILIIIGLVFFIKDRLKSGQYLQKALAEVSTEKLPTGMPKSYKGLMLEQIRYHHSSAIFNANKSVRNTKKSLKVADYPTYKAELQKIIGLEQGVILGGSELGLNLKNLTGYWVLYSKRREAYLFCKISTDGTTKFAMTEDKRLEGYTELNISPGSIKLNADSIMWDNTNTTPNIRLTRDHWLIEEESGSLSHYRRVDSKNIELLKKLGM